MKVNFELDSSKPVGVRIRGSEDRVHLHIPDLASSC